MQNRLWSGTINHKGENLTIEVFSRVRRSGYEGLVLATTIDLMQKGFITTINHEPDHFVIGVRTHPDSDQLRVSKPVAYIVFEPRASQGLAHVILGGTVEEYRQSGLYSALFLKLADFLRKPHVQDGYNSDERLMSIDKITGCYHVDNESARIMNEKLGRRPVRVTTEYKL